MQTPFPQDPELTAIAIAYKNPDTALIADQVLPRVPVNSTLFEYTEYNDPHKAFTVPFTKVSARGRVNRVDLSGQRKPNSTEDNAIEVPLSFYDVNPHAAPGAPKANVRGLATEVATSLVMLQRESEVSALVFDPAQYPTGNKEQVTGNDQWDDVDSTPIALIEDGLSSMLVRGNLLIFGQRAWSFLRRHADILKAVHGNSGDKGMATRQAVAELFEVQEVLVGTGFINLARPGEAPEMVRVWGDHAAAIFRDRSANTVGGLTFGFTAEYGSRVAGSIPDVDIGMRGGEKVRVGESTKPLIIAPHAGYLWEDAVSSAP